MMKYTEKSGTTLLAGASGATAVARINGSKPSSWPVVLEFGVYSVEIAQDGGLSLIHSGPLTENPAIGQSADIGSFSFHLTDGSTETGPRVAAVSVNGIAVAPTSISLRPAPLSEGAGAGTFLGTLNTKATAPVTYTLEASSLPAEIVGSEVKATAAVPPGAQSVTVRATNARGSLSQILPLPGPSAIYRGQHDPALPAFAGPTGGETTFTSPRGAALHPTGPGNWIYVDVAATGTGDGTSPTDAYTTIQAAITAARAGDTILVEPGIYPETLSVPADHATETDKIKLVRRGAGKVEVTGTNPLAGWTPCVSGDAGNNANWASMWKATFTPGVSTIPMSTRVLTQSGEMSYLRVSGDGYTSTDQMWTQNDKSYWWDSSTGGVSGVLTGTAPNRTLTLTSPVFGAYAAGALDDAVLMAHFTPGNDMTQCEITSHTPGSNQITAVWAKTASPTNYIYGDGCLLLNVAKDIDAAGQWAFKDNGDGTYTIFFWPYDDTKMDEIRFSERSVGINLGQSQHWVLYGLDFAGLSGYGAVPAYGIYTNYGYAERDDWYIEECRVAHCVARDNSGTGIYSNKLHGLRILNTTIEKLTSMRGLAVGRGSDTWIDQIKINKLGYSAASLSTAYEAVLSYSEISECRSTHGNGMSVYQGADKIVVWGNIIDTQGGIGVTVQQSANVLFGMNIVVAPEGDEFGHRGIENNGRQTPQHYVGDYFSGYITWLNNTIPPYAGWASDNISGIVTGKTPEATHNACNNVSMGGVDPYSEGLVSQPVTDPSISANEVVLGRFEDNYIIDSTPNQYSGPFPTNFPNNAYASTPGAVWADYANGDYSAKANGPIDGVGGDHSDLLPSGAWIDWFDFDRDVNGNAFDWSVNPPRGALMT